jgi:choline kinase
MQYKVLITTSGTGSRLGNITKYTNKALVRVGKKPAISYVIEAYPIETPFVITIGYFGEHIRDFLTIAYPERNFTFVEIDKYIGEGSSLGYSMLQARDHLQCPFIFHASDTIVEGNIIPPEENWIGVYKGADAAQYSSWSVLGGGKLVFNDKGAINFDYIHVGLIGIFEYKKYWEELHKLYNANPNDQSLNDCKVLVKMLDKDSKFTLLPFAEWYDTGNTAALQRARNTFVDHFDNLDKLEESIFLFDTFVVKFFHDEKIVSERVARARALGKLVPEIEGVKKNFYRYAYADGDTYAGVATPATFGEFLSWAKKNLWKPVHEVEDKKFRSICHDFYFEKTKKRVKQFLDDNNLQDEEHIINGEVVPTIKEMLEVIDFDWLADAPQYQFHGDFILDNTIKTKNGYTLIDWRHNFGGLLIAGDRYYDLAKLNHNLTVNHEIVSRNYFTVFLDEGNVVTCDILRKNNLVECQDILFDFIETEGLDANRVRLLTSICWLNMSPLHHKPYDQFLYYFSKLHLWQAIKNLQ